MTDRHFSDGLVEAICKAADLPGILGNCHASGTEIIRQMWRGTYPHR